MLGSIPAGGADIWYIGSEIPQNRAPAAIAVHSVMVAQFFLERIGLASFPPRITLPRGEKYAMATAARQRKLVRL